MTAVKAASFLWEILFALITMHVMRSHTAIIGLNINDLDNHPICSIELFDTVSTLSRDFSLQLTNRLQDLFVRYEICTKKKQIKKVTTIIFSL